MSMRVYRFLGTRIGRKGEAATTANFSSGSAADAMLDCDPSQALGLPQAREYLGHPLPRHTKPLADLLQGVALLTHIVHEGALNR